MRKVILEGYEPRVLEANTPAGPIRVLELTAPEGHEQYAIAMPKDLAIMVGTKLAKQVVLPGEPGAPPVGVPKL